MAGQTQIILAAIVERIESGALAPGDPIDEAELIETYGVSRTPLREALIRLDAAGLIRREKRKGATLFRPTLEEFLAILEVHAKLEGQAAALAARRLSRAHHAAIEAAVQACEQHHARLGDGSPDAYYRLNLAFHAAVAEAAGNPFLLEMIKTNARKLMAYYRARYHYAGTIGASAQDHRAIAQRIFAREPDAAEAAMARHVQFDQVTAMDLIAALG